MTTHRLIGRDREPRMLAELVDGAPERGGALVVRGEAGAGKSALLAADGLSNREIGERLYLSHRTISTHLYRIFPKLGITARSELRVALDAGMLSRV